MKVIQHDFDFRTVPPTLDDWEKVRPYLAQVQIAEPQFRNCVTTTLEYQEYEFFHSYLYGATRLRYIIGLDDSSSGVMGVAPLVFTGVSPEFELWEFVGALSHCEYVPPIPPVNMVEFLPFLPGFLDWYSSTPYWAATQLATIPAVGGLFELPPSFDAYLSSLSAKTRGKLRKNLRDNADLTWVTSDKVDWGFLNAVLPEFQAYWDGRRTETFVDQGKKVLHDLRQFERLPAGYLRAGYVYGADGSPLAANFALNTGLANSVLVDMLCVRRTSAEVHSRGIGIYCVLRNLQDGIAAGFDQYTMTPGNEVYKAQFFPGGVAPTNSRALQVGTAIDVILGGRSFYYVGGDTGEVTLITDESVGGCVIPFDTVAKVDELLPHLGLARKWVRRELNTGRLVHVSSQST